MTSNPSLKVSNFGEKELILSILSISNQFNHNVDFINKIGDDCSVITLNDCYLISTSDMLIEKTHFPKAMSFYQMGFKVVTVNVSDLASMGSTPLGFLLNMGIYKDLLLSDFEELVKGVNDGCNYYNIPLIGGDTNQSDEIILSGTALGEISKKFKPMVKYGFNVGDLVCITGKIGLAPLGFKLLSLDLNELLNNNSNLSKDYCELCINEALKPFAQLEAGKILIENSVKTATDITDGLASELSELLSRDKTYCSTIYDNLDYDKGIRIYENQIPVDEEYKIIAQTLNLDINDLMFHTGEDFQLLFTIDPNIESTLKNNLNFYVIGEVTNNNTLEMVLSNGDIKIMSSRGYQHLV